MQPVLILDNEDAVAEVLQLSSMPIPGVLSFGHVAMSLVASLASASLCRLIRLCHTAAHMAM